MIYQPFSTKWDFLAIFVLIVLIFFFFKRNNKRKELRLKQELEKNDNNKILVLKHILKTLLQSHYMLHILKKDDNWVYAYVLQKKELSDRKNLAQKMHIADLYNAAFDVIMLFLRTKNTDHLIEIKMYINSLHLGVDIMNIQTGTELKEFQKLYPRTKSSEKQGSSYIVEDEIGDPKDIVHIPRICMSDYFKPSDFGLSPIKANLQIA